MKKKRKKRNYFDKYLTPGAPKLTNMTKDIKEKVDGYKCFVSIYINENIQDLKAKSDKMER